MTDAVSAKLDGLREVIDERFKSFETQQSGQTAWLERLTDAVDRLSVTTSSFHVLETRQGVTEGRVSDLELDLEGVAAELATMKVDRAKASMIQNGLVALLASAATGVVGLLVTKLPSMWPF